MNRGLRSCVVLLNVSLAEKENIRLISELKRCHRGFSQSSLQFASWSSLNFSFYQRAMSLICYQTDKFTAIKTLKFCHQPDVVSSYTCIKSASGHYSIRNDSSAHTSNKSKPSKRLSFTALTTHCLLGLSGEEILQEMNGLMLPAATIISLEQLKEEADCY